MRAIAVIAGTFAGAALVVVWLRRVAPNRRRILTAAPGAIAMIVAFSYAGSALFTLGDQTISFARAGQTEVGRLPPPMPEDAVVAARNELEPGDTWTLYTRNGRCRADALRYFWLAFRLLPNAAECDAAPSVIVTYRLEEDLVLVLGTVVARGERWAVIRP